MPGWRAEGPATAPINFKGQVDLTKTEAENSITAKESGDYYIVSVGSVEQDFLDDNWSSLEHPVLTGAFILWSGSEWVEIPRPCSDEQRIVDLETKAAELETKVAELETKAADFEARITALENP